MNIGHLFSKALWISLSCLTDGFPTADMLLVSENPSDFHFCSHGAVALESSDDAEELLATDVRLVRYQSMVMTMRNERKHHRSPLFQRVLEK